jgi:hypothetical protein
MSVELLTVTCGDATPPKSTCGVPQHRKSSFVVVKSRTTPPEGEPKFGKNEKASVD